MKKTYKEKKAELIALSKSAKLLLQTGFKDFTKVNEVLLYEFYSKGVNLEYNTYKQWLEVGYRVKKGETAFCIWGRPRKSEKDKAENTEDEEYSFFPICYVFCQNQVEPIKKEAQ